MTRVPRRSDSACQNELTVSAGAPSDIHHFTSVYAKHSPEVAEFQKAPRTPARNGRPAPTGQVNTSRDLLQVTEQDDVALLGATRDRELFPVPRPGVPENQVAREMGQLLGLAAFER